MWWTFVIDEICFWYIWGFLWVLFGWTKYGLDCNYVFAGINYEIRF